MTKLFSIVALFLLLLVIGCNRADQIGQADLALGAGDIIIGGPEAGLIAIQSPAVGFGVWNDDGSALALLVDNSRGTVTATYGLELPAQTIFMSDRAPFGPVPISGVTLGAVGGSLHVAQTSPPAVTGSRASGAALQSLLRALEAQGLIVDNSTP